MDIIEVAIRNARIDAAAKAKRLQTKGAGKDATRKQRAKDANVRDSMLPMERRTGQSRVRFGIATPRNMPLQLPLRGILKLR